MTRIEVQLPPSLSGERGLIECIEIIGAVAENDHTQYALIVADNRVEACVTGLIGALRTYRTGTEVPKLRITPMPEGGASVSEAEGMGHEPAKHNLP